MPPKWTLPWSVLVRMLFVCLIMSLCIIFYASVHAGVQEDQTSHLPGDLKSFVPPPDEFDWIQLTSGEWLKGALKVLYEDKLEFDSDELDLLEFDWEDIKQIRGHGLHSMRFEGDITVTGVLRVIDDKVFITVGEERREFHRSQLIAIAPGEEMELDKWSAGITLGLTVRKGNTDLREYSALANFKRRTALSHFVTDYVGLFNETNDVETANNHRVTSYFDLLKTKKYYWRVVFAEYFRDPFQNIAHRVYAGSGIGYHIVDTAKTEWDITAGPAYQYLKYDSVEQGEKTHDTTPAFSVSTVYDTALTKRIDWITKYNFLILNEKSGRYTHHFITTLEIELTNTLDLDLSFIWDRIEKPRPNADGSLPEKDDLRFLVGLSLDY